MCHHRQMFLRGCQALVGVVLLPLVAVPPPQSPSIVKRPSVLTFAEKAEPKTFNPVTSQDIVSRNVLQLTMGDLVHRMRRFASDPVSARDVAFPYDVNAHDNAVALPADVEDLDVGRFLVSRRARRRHRQLSEVSVHHFHFPSGISKSLPIMTLTSTSRRLSGRLTTSGPTW